MRSFKGMFGKRHTSNAELSDDYSRLTAKAKDLADDAIKVLNMIDGPALVAAMMKLDELMFWLNRGLQQKKLKQQKKGDYHVKVVAESNKQDTSRILHTDDKKDVHTEAQGFSPKIETGR